MTTAPTQPVIKSGAASLRTKGPLDAAETADAAITAALVVALLAAGRVLAAGSMMQVIASFVVAVLAARRRSRAVWIATAAAACIALILGGLGPVSQATLAGVFGWCGGQSIKRGWGLIRSVLFSLLIAWPAMVASVLFFFPAVAINRKLRELVFENVENSADGIGNIVGFVLGFIGTVLDAIFGLFGADTGVQGALDSAGDSFASGMATAAQFLIDNWLLLIPATELVYATVYAILIRAFGRRILRRLEKALVDPVGLDAQPADQADPVPFELQAVPLMRNGVEVTAPLSLAVSPGEHVVIEGPNGAGKSTLLDTIAGLDNHGAVVRSGAVGLGSIGGTARVGQRPEAQVVGTTVTEDLRWGLEDGLDTDDDVRAVLDNVGLHDIPPDRPTSELSGGELQRLALASALRRSPKLLLADEVTSMLDPDEQARVIERLDALEGAAIVRTTHRNDAAASDRRVQIAPRNAAPESSVDPDEEPDLRTIHTSVTDTRLIKMSGAAFAHAHDKPWAHPVLDHIDLSIHRYEMVVIEGRNGSGKTTLARLIAGLDDPTAGTVETADGLKRALANQHVRLQLLRPTVREELFSLAGVRTDGADVDSDSDRQRNRAHNLDASIELFELESLLDRRIDELSGGQQRRALLAGLVARGVGLLVLDEPLAGLDRSGRADLAVTLDHVRLAGTSVVVVSHDVDWTPRRVDQQLRLDGGRIREVTR